MCAISCSLLALRAETYNEVCLLIYFTNHQGGSAQINYRKKRYSLSYSFSHTKKYNSQMIKQFTTFSHKIFAIKLQCSVGVLYAYVPCTLHTNKHQFYVYSHVNTIQTPTVSLEYEIYIEKRNTRALAFIGK